MDQKLRELVGRRVHRLRKESGLGVRELAREIGISASSLSALETNSDGGLSLKRLQQISDHFGLHVSDLLSEDGHRPSQSGTVEVFEKCSATGSIERDPGVFYQLIGPSHAHSIQPYLLSFDPGATYEEEPISHPGEECEYVLYGEVVLIFGDERIRLRQGDLVRFHSDVPHAFRNASDSSLAVVLGAMTPPW